MAESSINRIDTLNAPVAPTPNATETKPNTFRNHISAKWLNWETATWIALLLLAILSRLIDLGPRALHQDEATHAGFYSLPLYQGRAFYHYDPTFHGPFLYYMVSLAYFLFGDANDTTARVAPAVYGIGVVGLCWFLRPLIGKYGALFAAFFTLISPSILYYARNLRHDTFALFGELLFAVGFFRFIQNKPGHKAWWLTLAGIGLSITYASHELVFLNTAILVFWLVMAFVFEVIALPPSITRRRPKAIIETEFTPDVELDAEEVTEVDPATSASPTFLQRIMGSSTVLGVGLFIIFSLLVLAGGINLFSKKADTGDIPKVFGGVPSGLILIPIGILAALIAGYVLGNIYAAAWRRLEKWPNVVACITTVILFVGLGGFLSYRSLNPKKDTSTVVTTLTDLPSPVTSTDFTALGFKLPAVAIPLLLALLIALVIGPLVGWMWQRGFFVYTIRGLIGAVITFVGVWAVACLVSLRFAIPNTTNPVLSTKGGLLIVGPEIDKWLAYIINGFVFALVLGIAAGWLVSIANRVSDDDLRGSAAIRGVLRIFRQPLAIAGFFGGFALIYVLLFGNFFSYPEGLADGIYRGVEYWASVHDTRRIDEPWFYYPMLMLIYETLPLLLSIVALFTVPFLWVRRAMLKGKFVFTVRGLMAGYCLWWAVMAMIAYSIAGEKVPWLNMQTALPCILIAAIVFDNTARRIHWKKLTRPDQLPLFAALFTGMVIAIGVFIGLLANLDTNLGQPASNLAVSANTSNAWTVRLIGAIVAGLVAAGLFVLSVWLWRTGRLSGLTMRATILFMVTGLLAIYGVKATLMLNYDHPVTNTEPLIQVQSTPELMLFVERVDRLSRDYRLQFNNDPTTSLLPKQTIVADPTGGKNLPILLSNSVSPPLSWYFRKYTNVNYFTPDNDSTKNTDAAPPKDSRGNAYAIIATDKNEDQFKLQEQLKDNYTRQLYRRYWWFPFDDNGYLYITKAPADSTDAFRDKRKIQNTDWGKLWDAFTKQPGANLMWRYILYHEVAQQLGSYDMVVYIRNDLAPDFMALGGINYTGTAGNGNSTGAATDFAYALGESTQPGIKNGQFKVPRGVTIAPNGDILALDSGNGRVQRFSADGNYLSKFGKIGTGDGLLNILQSDGGAGGIAVDEEGNIYVSDSWNYRIQKFDPNGNLLAKWGQGFDTQGDPAKAQANPTGFYGPRGITYDPTRKELYVADTGNRRIVVFDKNGKYIRQFGSLGSAPGQFSEPMSVAVSADGHVYVTDLRNKRLQILDRDGKYQAEVKIDWREQGQGEPYVTVDAAGTVYVSDPPAARIYKYSADGKLLGTIENQTGVVLENPTGLAVSSDGYLYVADTRRNTITKIKLN